VDEDGFLRTTPELLGLSFDNSMSVMDIIQRINERVKEGRDHADIVREVFDWAYPNANPPESTIKGILRANRVSVPSRLPVKRSGRVVF